MYGHFDIAQKKAISILRLQAKTTFLLFLSFVFLNSYGTSKMDNALPAETTSSNFYQQSIISGTILDEYGDPLPGVIIVVQGTARSTVSDVDGTYSIEASPGEVLVFSYVGMISQEITVGGDDSVNVTLSIDNAALEEVVITGYTKTSREALSGSVSTVNVEDISVLPTPTLSSNLEGKAAGVQVSTYTGNPGSLAEIKIRASTLGARPLFVIDGVLSDRAAFELLDPSEIKDFSILKDAATTSMYGVKGAGGVIVINTLSSRTGKPTITYRVSTALDNPIHYVQPMNAYENALFKNKMDEYTGATPTFSDDELAFFKNEYNAKSMSDAVYEPWRASRSHHALTIGGGTEKISYNFAGNFFGADGITYDTHKRYALSTNIKAQVNDYITASMNLRKSNGNDQQPFTGINWWNNRDTYNIFEWLTWAPPWIPAKIDGKATSISDIGNDLPFNPFAIFEHRANGMSHDNINDDVLNGSVTVDVKVPGVEGLTGSIFYNQQEYITNRENYFSKGGTVTYPMLREGGRGHIIRTLDPNKAPRSFEGANLGYREVLWHRNNKSRNYTLRPSLSYDNQFGDHKISAYGMYEQRESTDEGFSAWRFDLPGVKKPYFNYFSSDKDLQGNGDYESKEASIGYLATANYSFADKYFMTATYRRDGSTRFHPDNRWGNFGGLSGAWVVSREDFFENIKPTVNYLRAQLSYGLVGSDAVGGWSWAPSYGQGTANIMINGGRPHSLRSPGRLPAKDLTWEKMKEWNFGLEMKFLDSRLSLLTELFKRKGYDRFGSRNTSVPQLIGISLPNVNYREGKTNGFELTAGWADSGGDLSYNISANYGYNASYETVVDIADNVWDRDNPLKNRVGRISALTTDGFVTSQEMADELAAAGYTMNGVAYQVGDYLFRDVHGDNSTDANGNWVSGEFKPDGTTKWNDWALTDMLNYNPHTFGLNLSLDWKGLSGAVQLVGQAGGHRVPDRNIIWNGLWLGRGAADFMNDHWSPENPDATFPKWKTAHNNTYFWATYQVDRIYESMAYVRLQNLNLSYQLPGSLMDKLKLVNSLSVYATGSNLATWSPFLKRYGTDPTIHGSSYPMMQTLTFGLNAKF